MPENELPPERKLQNAVRLGDSAEVRRLCELGIDEDKSHEWGPDFRSSLLYSAVKTYPDFSGGTPPKARATGHTEIVSYLLKRGANAKYIEEDDEPTQNKTLLHWAAGYGYKEIVALLIEHGADIDAKWEATGDTPLGSAVHGYAEDDPEPDEATRQRIFDTICLLVDRGADVNSRNSQKEYPESVGDPIIFRAIGEPKLIKYLVNNGADINAKGDLGWTFLHRIAMFAKGTATAHALIECGADVNARDNSGKTPLDVAQSDNMKAFLQSCQTPKPVSTSTPETATKNGCMGVFAIVACVVGLIIVFVIIKGTTASQSITARPVQSNSSALANANTISPATAGADNSRTLQSWQGEHFPQTRVSYLQEADIQGWSYSGVRYALNEMYARHGYLFKERPLQHQFQKFSWYHPASTATSADIEAQFTPIERANQQLLAERRNRLVQEGKAIK